MGNAANFIEIKTFHSYCFDLLGRVGTIEKSDEIIREAVKKIRSGEVEPRRITKTVLVIDEAQDIDADEYDLICALMEYNEDMRVIAVGDDDQNIFEFRGSSSEYLRRLIEDKEAVMYELVENFRSKSNIVDFSNQFLERIGNRLKKTRIMPVQNDPGKIRLYRYRSDNLIVPLVNNMLKEEISGTTCVLTKTNEEAILVAGLLSKRGMKTKLIQTNDGFNLYNILEVRAFLNYLNLSEDMYVIDDDTWEKAKRMLKNRFGNSLNYNLCENIIRDFEQTNTRYKYISDLEVFIRESKLEDFYDESLETIFVSTIHKAKGREFDNVYLMLDRFSCMTDESRRLLYVAITRTKQNLTIHYNGNYLDHIRTRNLEVIDDFNLYTRPNELTIQLGYRDIWLDYFICRQLLISNLVSGDQLIVDGHFCCNKRGQAVLRFSKQFVEQIETMKEYGYVPKKARIGFIVYWKKENTENEIRIILPEIHFERAVDAIYLPKYK